jgi:hypothetical protein
MERDLGSRETEFAARMCSMADGMFHVFSVRFVRCTLGTEVRKADNVVQSLILTCLV